MEQEGRVLDASERSDKLLLHRAGEEVLSDLGGQCRAAGVMWLGEQSMVGRADVHFHKGRAAWSRASTWRRADLSLRGIVQVKPHGNDYEGAAAARAGSSAWPGWRGAQYPILPHFLRLIHIHKSRGAVISPWKRRFWSLRFKKIDAHGFFPPCELWTFDTFSLFFLLSCGFSTSQRL